MNAGTNKGLARGADLRSMARAVLRGMPIPGHNMRLRDAADGAMLDARRVGVSRLPVGEFAVRVADGEIRVQPGVITASADSTSWTGEPDWDVGGATDVPRELPSGRVIVAVRCTGEFLQPLHSSSITEPDELPEVHLLEWPLPTNVLDNLLGGQVVWWVPLALIEDGQVHQLAMGPLKTLATAGWAVTWREYA